MNEMNKIDLLTYGIDSDNYEKVIKQDLKKVLNKHERCFIRLIAYD